MIHTKTEPFALRGNVLYTPALGKLLAFPDHYLLCSEGRVAGLWPQLPEAYRGVRVYDHRDCLILPGLCDAHLHAPQYAFRGLGMDCTLMDWLQQHAFPEELAYGELAYAQRAYGQFAQALRGSATTRAAVFATVHVPATLLLADLLEQAGLRGYVGKVNMDRNAPAALLDPAPEQALAQTEAWLDRCQGDRGIRPILTPRFVPSCSDALLQGLGELARRRGLPVQSHLSENLGEIAKVQELCPWSKSYSDVYERYGLFGGGLPTVMAHCVHSTPYEQQRLLAQGVLVAHCPTSNAALSSGIAPIRRYLDAGIRVALGTDIAAGFALSLFRAMVDAVQLSKVRSCFAEDEAPLTLPEAFYLATKGAEPLFGKVGSFEPGYAFDALVLDDSRCASPKPLSLQERWERAIYLEQEVTLRAKFVAGQRLFG